MVKGAQPSEGFAMGNLKNLFSGHAITHANPQVLILLYDLQARPAGGGNRDLIEDTGDCGVQQQRRADERKKEW